MMVFILLFVCAFVLMFSLLPLYFKQVLGLRESQIGALMSLNGILIVLFEMALIYALEQRWPGNGQKFRIMGLGVGLTGLAYAVLNISSWAGLAVVTMLLLTLGEILAMPFMQVSAVNRSNETNRGQYMAFYSMAWAFSQLISPFVGAQTVAHLGFSWLWWLATGVCAVSATGFWWISRSELAKTQA